MTQRKIYLDHAATSWPKPPGVLEACIEFQTQLGVAASRGAYSPSERTDRINADGRESLACVYYTHMTLPTKRVVVLHMPTAITTNNHRI